MNGSVGNGRLFRNVAKQTGTSKPEHEPHVTSVGRALSIRILFYCDGRFGHELAKLRPLLLIQPGVVESRGRCGARFETEQRPYAVRGLGPEGFERCLLLLTDERPHQQ